MRVRVSSEGEGDQGRTPIRVRAPFRGAEAAHLLARASRNDNEIALLGVGSVTGFRQNKRVISFDIIEMQAAKRSVRFEFPARLFVFQHSASKVQAQPSARVRLRPFDGASHRKSSLCATVSCACRG